MVTSTVPVLQAHMARLVGSSMRGEAYSEKKMVSEGLDITAKPAIFVNPEDVSL